jgi:hypothetical protein
MLSQAALSAAAKTGPIFGVISAIELLCGVCVLCG